MAIKCYLCNGKDYELVAELNQKPEHEVDYGIKTGDYHREIYKCRTCSVYFNVDEHIPADFYEGAYNRKVYSRKLLEKYLEIMSLPEERSDNLNRVKRIVRFCDTRGWRYSETSVLDVGSGLCVFLGKLKELGFKCYCIDPDPLAIEHALSNVGVDGGFAGTLKDYASELKFDIITFNKVLEHLKDPVETLASAKKFLAINGAIYIELPNADKALNDGGVLKREEFDLGHFTIYSKASVEYLSSHAGFELGDLHEVRDPSGKYTIYAFLMQDDL